MSETTVNEAAAAAPAPKPKRPKAKSMIMMGEQTAAEAADPAAGRHEGGSALDAMQADEAEMRRRFAHAGRNDPCPCGSGKKFKDCHGKLA